VKVIIVGSGIIGLATAYELAKRGCEVTVAGEHHVPVSVTASVRRESPRAS